VKRSFGLLRSQAELGNEKVQEHTHPTALEACGELHKPLPNSLLRPVADERAIGLRCYCACPNDPRRLKVEETFSNDRHFSAAGFRTLF
jgi:hypothetical protein